ncbi:MAG TPA: hypothetical protein VHP58_03010 [Alphaproteobacteria bacterium]|nr:hypothetical protein [Alphaproteobacteria bacterium]
MSDTPYTPRQPGSQPGVPSGQGPANAQKKNQFHARLENQKAQLERHGNFAEVVIRTTPEGTDMINFARLWEHVLVQADRQTRGYVAKSSRGEFETTRKDFDDCVEFMVQKIKSAVQRHKLDLAGTNFISRVAQRYSIVDKVRKGPSERAPQQAAPAAAAESPAATEAAPAKKPARAAKPKAEKDDVDAL